ncbi:MAG: RHS repeat-associated core domain-containing protein, partial [Theionarchaea archaeon]|nr:RHS repeat-associated core domain-containing protein [Theionarchaea archaeon]
MIFTNGRGYQRIFWFDWLSRLTKVEEEYETDLFAVTTYQYGEGNHLLSFTDAENHTTSYTYGSLFGLTRITYPDSEYEEYTYDTSGNVASYTDAEGNSTHLIYDALYRLTQIQYDQSVISFAYDLNSNRIRMDDNSPSEGDYCEYIYDEWNRLATETRHISQTAYTITYQYDIASRLTTLTYPDNMQILYSYDDLNRIAEIKRYTDGVTDEILLDNVQYNTESLLTQFDYGNDLRALFSYDSRDRISTIAVKNQETSYLNLNYSYDSNANITEVINGWRDTSSDWHSQTELYSYDGLDRLVTATSAAWSHTYSYDKAGNRIAKDQITSTINAVNQVTDVSDGTTFTYDRNGNRTGKTNNNDTWLYTYDYANRLTKVEKNSVILGEYIYDGDGKRIQTIEDSKSTTYIYSGLNILYEENTTGTALYIYGPTGRLAKRTTINNESSTFYYHADHQGSTRLVTDESKFIVTDVTYEPFGESTITGEESFLYTGKEKDTIDLYYYGARYYDPETGRFITRDSLAGKKALPQSLNRYTYCLNNSIKYTDPAGLTYRMCDVNTGRCFRIREFGKKVWTAYDEDGNKITDSQEIESLLDQTGKTQEQIDKDQARAAYLMLLVTHPEIEGNPDAVLVPADFLNTEHTTWFEVTVTVDGEEATLYIGIDDRPEYKGSSGNSYYGDTYKRFDGSIQITLFQNAFTSVAALFHVVGHEGQHMVGLLRNDEELTSEVSAYDWNRKNDNKEPYFIPWPWVWSIPYG